MRFARRHRLFTSWIAALAVLMACLAPSVSQALGSKPGAGGTEVCSARGLQRLQAEPGDGDPAPMAASMFEHCPYCSMHMPVLGVPPQPTCVPSVLGPEAPLPPGFLQAPRTAHAWVSAQPRAPPVSC